METSTRIPVPGTYNFRDVGGLPADTGVVRSGVLYRSDGLHRLGIVPTPVSAKLPEILGHDADRQARYARYRSSR